MNIFQHSILPCRCNKDEFNPQWGLLLVEKSITDEDGLHPVAWAVRCNNCLLEAEVGISYAGKVDMAQDIAITKWNNLHTADVDEI